MPDSPSTSEKQVTSEAADVRDPASSSADSNRSFDLSDLAEGRTQFGANLEPALRTACNDRLSEVRWFRADWQRGGALTGYAAYCDDAGDEHEVVVKLPVPPVERKWLVRLQDSNTVTDVVPRLFQYGDELGGYDLIWVVMERLAYGPIGSAWGGAAFDLFVEAVGRFAWATSAFEVEGEARHKDWKKIHQMARDHIRRHDVANEQQWQKALKKAHRHLKDWIATWEDRPTDDWCHGDLHPGNAMTRVPPPDGPVLLFDLAEAHRGHWLEDAVYFEHLYWSKRDQLDGRKLCNMIAKQRKKHDLPVEKDWSKLASVQRALLAMATPAMLQHEGNPAHVAAALQVLEREVG